MLCMKKFIKGLLLSVVAFCGVSVALVACNDEIPNSETTKETVKSEREGLNDSLVHNVRIVEENGFKVLEDNNEKTTTIVAQIEDNDSDGDGYVSALNVYDDRDEVAIHKESYKKGDVVLITFEGDDVVSVGFNKDNVGDKVKVQKIIK